MWLRQEAGQQGRPHAPEPPRRSGVTGTASPLTADRRTSALGDERSARTRMAAPELHGLADMRCADPFGAGQVGDRPRHFLHTMKGAGG